MGEDGKNVKCTIEEFDGNKCNMSNIAVFFNRISVTLPIFGTLVFIFNWVFVIVFTVWIIFAGLQTPKSDLEEEIYEEEEEESLLR